MSRAVVTVRLFSVLRERAGTGQLELDAEGLETLGDVADALFGRLPTLEPYRRIVRLARNRVYAEASESVRPGDEVAIITPVSGG